METSGVVYTPNGVLSHELATAANSTTDPALQGTLKKLQSRVDNLEQYLEDVSSPETALQAKIWQDTISEDWQANFDEGRTTWRMPTIMISGKVEGQFLRMMAEMTKAERILEIGMFTGYSSVSFAQSPYAKEVVSLETEPYCEEFMRKRADPEIGKKIRVLIGKGLDGLKKLKDEGKKFDLVFIDADKGNYINYYKYIMDNSLLDPQGAFLIDNALWSGEVYTNGNSANGVALREFNEFVRNDERVIQVIVPLRDGVMLIKPKVANGIYGN